MGGFLRCFPTVPVGLLGATEAAREGPGDSGVFSAGEVEVV